MLKMAAYESVVLSIFEKLVIFVDIRLLNGVIKIYLHRRMRSKLTSKVKSSNQSF